MKEIAKLRASRDEFGHIDSDLLIRGTPVYSYTQDVCAFWICYFCELVKGDLQLKSLEKALQSSYSFPILTCLD